jgi:hypothetical protein
VFVGAANGWEGSGIERSETKDADSNDDVDWKAFQEAVTVSSFNISTDVLIPLKISIHVLSFFWYLG